MSKEASFLSMQQAILRYINSRIPKDKNCAQVGIIRGGAVTIGNQVLSMICILGTATKLSV